MFEGMHCSQFKNAMEEADPPIYLQEGQLCEKLIQDMLNSSYQNLKMSDELSSSSKCDPKYLVNMTSKYEPRHEDPHFLDDSSYQVPYYLNFTNTSS